MSIERPPMLLPIRERIAPNTFVVPTPMKRPTQTQAQVWIRVWAVLSVSSVSIGIGIETPLAIVPLTEIWIETLLAIEIATPSFSLPSLPSFDSALNSLATEIGIGTANETSLRH
jgi:hypothetical protein